MEYIETYLKGSYLIKPEIIEDERGYFSRLYFEDELKEKELSPVGIQCNSAFNYKRGTLRGMHYQFFGYEQDKLVRCTKGSIYDVIIDLRKNSKTYCGWYSVTLTESNNYMLYVPKGFAHGYQTLEDNTEVFYQLSQRYVKEQESGIKYNDPIFGILWPIKIISISERDLNHPKYEK
jgi:dTDP-4-dehydrorhamnose 3,5-epimerase